MTLTQEFDNYALTEHERIISNLIRFGTVTELDAANARVRVNTGGVDSDWMPWLTSRAGADRTWHAPAIGEQVVVLMPTGELAQGVVVGAIYQTKFPAPASDPAIWQTTFADGTVIAYDRGKGTASITIKSTSLTVKDGEIDATVKLLKVSGDLNVGGDIVAGGDVKAGGDVIAGGISLKNHTHPTPQGKSGPPST